MRKLLILLLCILITGSYSYAFDLVLPIKKKSIVNTNYAFFVGKARKNEHISINDSSIYIAPNGAFAYTVKLKNGENRIALKTDYSTHIYKFYKEPAQDIIKPELEEFEPKVVTVDKDNTPLRKTPIDYGLNRIAHLFEGTKIIINGQKGDFYRVHLSKNKEGWIAKNSVSESETPTDIPKFITTKSETFKNGSVHTIEFSEKLPYTISETDKEIIFKIYNPQADESSVYTLNIKKPEKYFYRITLSGGIYVIKVNSMPKSELKNLDGLTIAVDAGHGGSEFGAIGCLGDKEKDINLAIANELKNILEVMGACVVMTRECDGFVSLDERVKIAKDNCADIFVSIHLNSIPDIKMDIHKNRGTSVYYYNNNSEELAKAVQKSVTESLQTRNDGVKTASFAVIRPADYVGILVENAYMTNPLDSMIYKEQSFPRNAAMGIANGILKYVNSKD